MKKFKELEINKDHFLYKYGNLISIVLFLFLLYAIGMQSLFLIAATLWVFCLWAFYKASEVWIEPIKSKRFMEKLFWFWLTIGTITFSLWWKTCIK